MTKKIFFKMTLITALVVPSVLLSNSNSVSASSTENSIESTDVPLVSTDDSIEPITPLTRATWGETGIYQGVSSASTTRVKVKSKMNVVIHNYTSKNGAAKVTIFKSGVAWYTYYVSSHSDVTLKGSGDFSVRIYNNSAKNIRASATIKGS